MREKWEGEQPQTIEHCLRKWRRSKGLVVNWLIEHISYMTKKVMRNNSLRREKGKSSSKGKSKWKSDIFGGGGREVRATSGQRGVWQTTSSSTKGSSSIINLRGGRTILLVVGQEGRQSTKCSGSVKRLCPIWRRLIINQTFNIQSAVASPPLTRWTLFVQVYDAQS